MSPPLGLEKSNLVPLRASVVPPFAPTRTPWLLTGLALMALNAYFPQLSPVSSLWSPFQAAVPVLHWAASWWFVLLGWEPNLVSLAPLSHIPIPCVEPGSQDAMAPAKGQRQLTDSECEALLNCLNGGMAVWNIASQFGVTARYIANINTKYGNTGKISKSTKAKQQPKLLQPVQINTIKQWVARDCHLDTLAVQSMLTTEFGLSVSKTLVYKTMVDLGFSWKVLRVSLYNRNSEKTIKD
ncbi:hypothetical protein DSO57_1034827 [Entomophthora muscae]|uniref:Uncharacterized protein n=1 Tax=Entomophthora muscae TaxID=34485 RepID=A0ACC2UJZ8_9FUNG|nr:hypothetical protein DSO57_1034827 [Entomophthora muscae]